MKIYLKIYYSNLFSECDLNSYGIKLLEILKDVLLNVVHAAIKDE